MTIPSNIILPMPPDGDEYLRELIYRLQDMYEQLATNANGTYLYANADTTTSIFQGVWIPILKGISTTMSFTYTQQIGYCVRKGLIVNAFFDVSWSGSSGTPSDVYLELPYKVRKSNGYPFICPLIVDSTVFAGNYVVGVAVPDTYRLEVWDVVTAGSSARITLPTGGGRIAGSITYIGQEDENT
jgi:hypothetical protein